MADGIPEIRACAFDAYGTLFDVSGSLERLRRALGDATAQALLAHWRAKQLQYTWLRSLVHRHASFWQVTCDALDWAMEMTGVDDAVLRADLLADYRALPPYDDVIPTLTALRDRGIRTLILSNGEPTMLADAVSHARLDDSLDDVLSVEAIGVFKPDPRVYQLAVDRTGVAAQHIAFMTSNAWDAAGAACFGLSVVWVNRFGAPSERLPGRPIAQLRSLATLPDLIVG